MTHLKIEVQLLLKLQELYYVLRKRGLEFLLPLSLTSIEKNQNSSTLCITFVLDSEMTSTLVVPEIMWDVCVCLSVFRGINFRLLRASESLR